MPGDSDTESDSGSSAPKDESQYSFAPTSFLQPSPIDDNHESLNQRAILALKQITLFDLATVQQDNSLHADILVASDSIIRFFDANSSPTLSTSNRVKILSIFADLVDVSFLSVLFDHRKVAQNMAARATTPGTTSSTIICWVDVLLAKLSVFAMAVANGFSPPSLAVSSDYMRAQRDEDCIWAASQLPEKWKAMIGVPASNQASPAARRLAMRLLFAAYVMGPQLSERKFWISSETRPADIMDSMLSSLHQKQYNGLSMSPSTVEYDNDERANYAMLVSLYSASQVSQRVSQVDRVQSPLRTWSLGSFLNIIQVVLHGSTARYSIHDKSLPYEHLDLAQTILVRWGEFVPWCWDTWDDQRIANVECITDLTSTWLYHMNTPFCVSIYSENLPAFKVPIEDRFGSDNARFRLAILQMLQQITLQLSTPQTPKDFHLPLAIVVHKACLLVIQFLRSTSENLQHGVDPLASAFCRCLVILFCTLRETEEEIKVKDLALEGLTLVGPQVIHSVLQDTRQNNGLQLATQFDDAVVRTSRALSTPSPMEAVLAAKLNLEFFSIVWHSNTKDFVTCGATSSFLRTVLDVLGRQIQEKPEKRTLPILRDTLLTAISVMSRHSTFQAGYAIRGDIVWDLARQAGCCDFVAASGFAHYISMIDQIFAPLQYVEAWDYLRDVLLLICSGRLAEEDEALALLVCPMLCLALLKILQIDLPSSRFILSSPWTVSLCTQLLALTNKENPPISRFMVALRLRLERVGKAILDQISQKLQGTVVPVDGPHMESQLVYCYAPTGSRLVLVPLVRSNDDKAHQN
ncbi:hypothetical protein Hypma_015376 [Hypsizygus marmoreus]|uniref:Uncharacterized protein n=1 Tax=Hypsizygus marmoreus TaxID=39966 RepID=A0A369KAM0_HYPMA|nr:hypothetical protein Hypma_015376 [Hypsizygus marmoreus]